MPPLLCWKASMAKLQEEAGLTHEFWWVSLSSERHGELLLNVLASVLVHQIPELWQFQSLPSHSLAHSNTYPVFKGGKKLLLTPVISVVNQERKVKTWILSVFMLLQNIDVAFSCSNRCRLIPIQHGSLARKYILTKSEISLNPIHIWFCLHWKHDNAVPVSLAWFLNDSGETGFALSLA